MLLSLCRYTKKGKRIIPAVVTPCPNNSQVSKSSDLDPIHPECETPCVCVTHIHIRIHTPWFCISNHLCSEIRRVTTIFAGSVFHLIGSKVCWLTAQKWRPHRPFWKHLCSLAGQVLRYTRSGGETSNMCLSVYCSLEKKQTHTHFISAEIKCIYVHVTLFWIWSLCIVCEELTCQVEFYQCVSGGWSHCSEQVDGVVSEAVAVGKIQFCEMGHVADHQAQSGVTDVQSC